MGRRIFLQSNGLAGRAGWAALLALGLAACGPGHEADCLKSNGAVTTQRRAVDRRLREVVLYDNVDLIIVPDTAIYAEVRAGENVIGDIEFSTPAGPQQLAIRNTSRCNWVRSYATPREVRLHVPHLRYLGQRGYGRISNEGQWAQDTLVAHIFSTGDISLNLRSTYVFAGIYDAGDITLRGEVRELYPSLGSNGFLLAAGLDTQLCAFYTFPTWVGDAHVLVRQNLRGTLNGTGTFYYRGSPPRFSAQGPNAARLVPE